MESLKIFFEDTKVFWTGSRLLFLAFMLFALVIDLDFSTRNAVLVRGGLFVFWLLIAFSSLAEYRRKTFPVLLKILEGTISIVLGILVFYFLLFEENRGGGIENIVFILLPLWLTLMGLREIMSVERIDLNKSIISPGDKYVIESYEEFQTRYDGFGKEVYDSIKKELPEVFEKLTFYNEKNAARQSYAEHKDINFRFCIQLDDVNEVITLWNRQKQIKIGNWIKKDTNYVISTIKIKFLK